MTTEARPGGGDRGTSAMADLYERPRPRKAERAIRLAYLLTGERERRRRTWRTRRSFAAWAGSHYLGDSGRRSTPTCAERSSTSTPRGLRRREDRARLASPREGAAEVRPRTAFHARRGCEVRTCGGRSPTRPARQRAALVLRYYEDLSEQDTAAVLRCSVAAVKSLVARGSSKRCAQPLPRGGLR